VRIASEGGIISANANVSAAKVKRSGIRLQRSMAPEDEGS
jgi:hypothetical protein